jgi:hypothetical protein
MDLFSKYKRQIEYAFDAAERFDSKLVPAILEMEGMTGYKTRHFYNQLLAMSDVRYLEIGAWKGSSICAAMYGNRIHVICIDNWSEFGGPKAEFLQNFLRFRGENNALFIEHDCFTLDTTYLPFFNIYMYDGNHEHDSHSRALTHYIDRMDDIFIYIVDDWNASAVREGTREAINRLALEVLYEREIRLTHDDTHTELNLARATWWNGIYVAILKKPTSKQ